MPRASTRNRAAEFHPQSQEHGGSNGAAGRIRKRTLTDEDAEGQDDEEELGSAGEENNDDKSLERKANELVRLALFTEYRRTTLKRDDIAKKVLGGRATKNDFQPVLERAQHILHKTFGMELHEIMSRAERDRAEAAREGATNESELNAPGPKKKVAVVSSKQYILRSSLDPVLIESANIWDAEIEEAERVENKVLYPNARDLRPEGTLISWKHASSDQLGSAGILHVILALILVNGRVLTDMQLRTYLKRLRLPMGSSTPVDASGTGVKTLTIDAYLTQLLKQSYLDKEKTALASNHVGGNKRLRGGAAAGGGDDGNTSFEWKWGTRAISEIGEDRIGSFIAEFMDDIERERERRRGDEEDGRGSGRKEKEVPEKRKAKLVKAIGRAAGGGLVPFK